MAFLRKRHLFWLLSTLLIIVVVALVMALPGNSKNFEVSRLSILTKDGEAFLFSVEVAKSDREKATGLMFREKLAENSGMLFLNEEDAVTDMWMKNTKIPLDMLFLTRNGTIVAMHQNAEPESADIISSTVPVKGVLEVSGGTIQKLGLEVGDLVLHRALTH